MESLSGLPWQWPEGTGRMSQNGSSPMVPTATANQRPDPHWPHLSVTVPWRKIHTPTCLLQSLGERYTQNTVLALYESIRRKEKYENDKNVQNDKQFYMKFRTINVSLYISCIERCERTDRSEGVTVVVFRTLIV